MVSEIKCEAVLSYRRSCALIHYIGNVNCKLLNQIGIYVLHNLEAHSRYLPCRGKAINITYSECVSVALVIQHTLPMRGIVLSSVDCRCIIFFHAVSYTHDFRGGGVTKNKMFVLIFSPTFV